MKNKIFLDGVLSPVWRNKLVKIITDVSYFNPIDYEGMPKELYTIAEEKSCHCNVHFYYINSIISYFQFITDILFTSIDKNKITIVHIDPTTIENEYIKLFLGGVDVIRHYGGICYIDNDLHRSARIINNCFCEDKYDISNPIDITNVSVQDVDKYKGLKDKFDNKNKDTYVDNVSAVNYGSSRRVAVNDVFDIINNTEIKDAEDLEIKIKKFFGIEDVKDKKELIANDESKNIIDEKLVIVNKNINEDNYEFSGKCECEDTDVKKD